MSKMKFTETVPKVPGLYWARLAGNMPPKPYEVKCSDEVNYSDGSPRTDLVVFWGSSRNRLNTFTWGDKIEVPEVEE